MNLSQTEIARLPGCDEETQPPRIAWVDVAKGLGIILVVFGHVWRGVELSSQMPPRLFKFVDTAIYSFHMPLFFILAGIFLPQSLRKSTREFIFSKLRTIAYPYLVWYVLQGSVSLLLFDHINMPPTPAQLVRHFFTGEYAQFWFLYTLFNCLFLYLMLSRLALNAMVITFIAATLYFSSRYFEEIGGAPLAWLCQYFIYLALGALAAPLRHIVHRVPASIAWAPMMGGFAIVFFAAGYNVQFLPISLLIALAGVVGVIFLSRLLEHSRALGALGAISLQIYVAHILAAAGSRIVLEQWLQIHNLPLLLGACTAAALLFPALLVWITRVTGFEVLFSLETPDTKTQHPLRPAALPCA